MDWKEVVDYYSRIEIQKAILLSAKDREVAVRVGESFAKRPDILQFPGDVKDWARKGATSFHISEERWKDPMSLETGLVKKQMDALRIGWDLVIDIDSPYWDFARQTASFVVELLRELHNIDCVGTKFSVSGDTPVLVLHKKSILLIPIKGAIEIFKKGEKLKVLSLNKEKKLAFSKVCGHLEHEDVIYEILHENSKIPLKATAHHSVFALEEGRIVQKKVSELKKGDSLITFNTNKNIMAANIKNVTNQFQFSINQFIHKSLNRKVKINKGLMRLIGYYLAEGHVTNIINQVGFSFNINEKNYIGDCVRLLAKITKRHISIRHPNSGSTQILIHSKEWATFFERLCGKSKGKHLPEFVWTLPKLLFMELLKGYIRGDGYKLGKYHIAAKSVAQKLITELVWACKLNGISCSLSCEQNKPHKLPQGNIFKGSFVYIINIPKSEINMPEFFRGRNKFSPFPRERTFPTDGLKKVYLQAKPALFNYHRLEHATLRKKRANSERILKVIFWLKKFNSQKMDLHSREIIANYESLLKSDTGILQVRSVEKKANEKVYDISVEDTESFFGNYYPILLHNSGNKGFHISVPFEAFPQEIDGIAIKDYFPDGLKRIALYLQDRIVEHWKTNLLRKINPKVLMQIVGQAGKQMPDIMTNNEIDVLKFIEIDTVLISSRHMFRAPYSLHEKSGLVSIPINPDEILFFDKNKAKPANVKADMKFILRDTAKPNEASSLIMQAFDWFKKSKKEVRQEEDTKTRLENSKYDNELPKEKIPEENFPPCMKKILEGKLDDGKKRALFLVLKFLIHTGWNWADIEARLVEWNKTHSTPLRDNYIQEQITWHKKQKTVVLPPNCDKQEYYKELQFCSPLPLCSRIHNPVNFAKIKASKKDYEQKKYEENKPKEKKAKKSKKEKPIGESPL